MPVESTLSMNSNSALSRLDQNVPIRRLAPIISLIPVSIDGEAKPKRKKITSKEVFRTKAKANNEIPQFYDRPIYKPKKYDLL